MNNNRFILLKYISLLSIILIFIGCGSSKKIVYFQDVSNKEIMQKVDFQDAKIQKDDLLKIVVSASDKDVIQPYNLTLGDISNYGGSSENSTIGYLVNNTGEINFPILGRLKVEGMTRTELENYLTTEIGKDVKNPIVSVTFKNFKITVLGEVRTPGTYTVNSEKISILQALGMAGDLNITGKRDQIVLLRDVNDQQQAIMIDLKSKELLESPYFYLQQNDVLYIPPSKTKIKQGRTNTGLWAVCISSVSVLTTIIALILR